MDLNADIVNGVAVEMHGLGIIGRKTGFINSLPRGVTGVPMRYSD